jgi:hypothetical protein
MDSLRSEIVFHPPADLTIDPPTLLDPAIAASEAKKA